MARSEPGTGRRLTAVGALCIVLAAPLVMQAAGAAEVAPDARILVIGDSNAIAFREVPSLAWTNRLERSEDLFVQVWGGPGLSIAHPLLGLARLSECATAVPGLNSLRAAILDLGSKDYSGAPAALQAAADWIGPAGPGLPRSRR